MADIFVFGSNLLGIHKKGAALTALQKHGAILGQGIGFQGNSYAIPTKANPSRSLHIVDVNFYVARFLQQATLGVEFIFNVTPIGCGLAGFKPEQIAPMFSPARYLSNVKLPQEFVEFLPWLSSSPNSIATFDKFE